MNLFPNIQDTPRHRVGQNPPSRDLLRIFVGEGRWSFMVTHYLGPMRRRKGETILYGAIVVGWRNQTNVSFYCSWFNRKMRRRGKQHRTHTKAE